MQGLERVFTKYLFRDADAPDGVARIIRYKKGAGAINGNTNWASICFTRLWVSKKAGQKIFDGLAGATIAEWHEEDFISREFASIPGSMLPDKHPALITLRKRVRFVEGEAQRSGVCTDGEIRFDCFPYQVRTLRLYARIYVRAEITVWPAVEATLFYGGHIVRDQIVTEVVSFVDRCPKHVRAGLPVHSVGIT